MADRLPSLLTRSLLTRVAALVLVALGATAGLTYAAGSRLPSAPPVSTVAAAPAPPLVIPDVRNQAFVFAKGTLEEAGFAWLVNGSVRGYSSNLVVSQTPAPGTRVVDAGAPRITLVLKRGSYPQTGEPEDTSPYAATVPQPADLAGRPIGPAAPLLSPKRAILKHVASKPATPKHATPAVVKSVRAAAAPATATSATTATPAPTVEPAATSASWPKQRPAAFDMPGARKEPLDEMPLPNRASALLTWLDAQPAKTSANVAHWMFQHEWIVTGASMGWWHGADALQTLVAADRRVQQMWGIGAKSESLAQQALHEVRAKARS